jgi:DNA invertase Pin-like site-specific DNA recombinase
VGSFLIERTKAGMARAKRNGTKSGKAIGRPPTLLPRDEFVAYGPRA